MTEVAFHLNVGDRSAYACRLLRKAYLKGSRLLVLGDESTIDVLDRALWLMGQGEFVPHARDSDPSHVLRQSPIMLSADGTVPFAANVLVNMGRAMPVGLERFERVIELVSGETAERQEARGRWRQYKAAGLEPLSHDLAVSRDA
jgi:DNA polymerase III subunit chi